MAWYGVGGWAIKLMGWDQRMTYEPGQNKMLQIKRALKYLWKPNKSHCYVWQLVSISGSNWATSPCHSSDVRRCLFLWANILGRLQCRETCRPVRSWGPQFLDHTVWAPLEHQHVNCSDLFGDDGASDGDCSSPTTHCGGEIAIPGSVCRSGRGSEGRIGMAVGLCLHSTCLLLWLPLPLLLLHWPSSSRWSMTMIENSWVTCLYDGLSELQRPKQYLIGILSYKLNFIQIW